MKKLFNEKVEARERIDSILKAADYGGNKGLIEMYRQVSPLMERIKALDRAIESDRKKLAKILELMLSEIQVATHETAPQRTAALAEPARALARILFDEAAVPSANVRKQLLDYQRQYGNSRRLDDADFVAMFDEIFADKQK